MKKILLLSVLIFPLFLHAQIITTIAGNGTGANGSPAITASIYDPNGLVIDRYGNIYFSQNLDHVVRKIDTAGIISTIAGTGNPGFSGDGGPAHLAELNQPCGIDLDSIGNLYITDGQNYRVRKVNVTTGIISTVVGNSTMGFSGDGGPASAATISSPSSICFDNLGNYFISDDNNHRIRKVSKTGYISTVAGNGILGSSGDGGQATSAAIFPYSICLDRFNRIYIAEWGTGLGTVRMIDTNGIITTIAGSTTSGLYNGDEIPAKNATLDPGYLKFDGFGKLYISDVYNNRIRVVDNSGVIHTLAGTGIGGNSGDGGDPKYAQIFKPSGFDFDSCGNLIFAQVGIPRIRKITYPHCNYLGVENENQLKTDIAIHPNPTYDQINIDNLPTQAKYRLLNTVGVTVLYGTLQPGSNQIPVASLPVGLYILELTDEQNKRTITKIVKQ